MNYHEERDCGLKVKKKQSIKLSDYLQPFNLYY